MTQLTKVDRANGDDFSLAASGREAMVEVASSRAAQEVQAAMAIAKRFPRDEIAAFNRIMKACKRKSLAEQALYAYPKGGQTVTGPSIRLAEMLAQNWGNVDFGIVELEQRDGESTVLSYAWDLETNTRQTKVFNVRHERHTKRGAYSLSDPREIYELTANQGARRLRACILGIIPGDVVDAAVSESEKTMAGNNAEPLVDRVRAMVGAFAEMGVTKEMIEKRVAHKVETLTEAEMVQLKKIYRSLRDNMADRADFFELEGAPTTNLGERLAQAKAQRAEQPAAPDQQTPAVPERDGPVAAGDVAEERAQAEDSGDQRLVTMPPVPETEEALVDVVAGMTDLNMADAAKKLKVALVKPWPQMRDKAGWWQRFCDGEIKGLVPVAR